jgi:hypothetical protein
MQKMPASVKGGVELRKALRAFTPDLAKELPKEVAAALKPITRDAKGYLPTNEQILSGWLPRQTTQGNFPTYNVSLAKSGIGYKTTPSKANSKGFRSLASVRSKNAAASIYERMGKLSPDSRFVKNQMTKYSAPLKGQGSMQGRVLFKAYDENNGKAREAVLSAIQSAAKKLNQRATVRG